MQGNTQVSDAMVERGENAAHRWSALAPDAPFNFTDDEAKSLATFIISAALAGHVVGWRDIASAPKDGTWVLLCEDHCWPPDLVRWKSETPERTVNGNRHMAVPAGWFGSPGGRSRFDVPDGHLMKATRWMPLPAPPALERGG